MNDPVEKPASSTRLAAWSWIPTLYFAEGLPLIVVMMVATVMYKELGISNTQIALYTSLLYLPWTIKPLWSPLVDLFGTQRGWVVMMQGVIAAAMAGVAYYAPSQSFFVATLACFWVMAIGSATHDIAADGFYMSTMSARDQAWFVGIRSSFYRLATIAGSGLLVMLAGYLGDPNAEGESLYSRADAWSWAFTAAALLYAGFAVYHFFFLPRPKASPRPTVGSFGQALDGFVEVFVSFFRKPHIVWAVAYMLLYRFSEAQLAKLKAPFLIDAREEGGIGLATMQLGWLDGTIGVSLLTLGGILGGLILARDGLERWIFPMALAINLPNALYAWLAFAQPASPWAVGAVIAVEQLGYGLGFSAYMLYMLYFSRGEHQTAHYAICTGFMALGMMIPGMFCGRVQELLGYDWFFVWVTLSMIPSLIVTSLLPLPNVEETE
ncbi:MFS transporter [Botrimarina colliarenosi]|uniref:MFS transporter n=1 Tax=Botrimarina colliarenosi TaxID=2528001 RepID=UPI0018D496C1|nr:MFS transporter [Botrimarina colliarenosi]